ncbi:hypothetical protein HOG21_05345 [bacterium]|jgi:hypothetical protein|nr:hypothetical protein [bacterium]
MEDIKFIISKESKHICTIDGDTCIMVNNILLNNNDNSNNKTISLPKTINHKLKIFLNNTEILTENTIKDCYAFVAFLYNLNVTNRKIIFEEFTKINSSDLQV